MSKNLIYIVAIDDSSSKISVDRYFQYSLPTWEHYCNRHGIDLIVIRSNQFDRAEYPNIKPIWNKELIYCLDGIEQYDKIGIVDTDTMIRWDAPDIFESVTDDDFCGVNDLCDLDWMFKSINDRQAYFPEVRIDPMNYINAGVLFFGKRYLSIFEDLLMMYLDNRSSIDQIQGGGKEQTLLNFVLTDNKVSIKKLSPSWNLLSIHRKNMFTGNWQLKQDQTPYFIKYAYIWHFTGFPIEDRIRVMNQTWEIIKKMNNNDDISM